MTIRKRTATDADRDFLYELNCRAYRDVVVRQFGKWDERWQRDYFEEKLRRAAFQIIEQDGKLVGAIWVEEEADHVVLHEIQILPDYQGRGIGSTLLKEEIEKARGKNKPMRLRVLKESRARQLYERLGFIVCGQTDTHVQMELTD